MFVKAKRARMRDMPLRQYTLTLIIVCEMWQAQKEEKLRRTNLLNSFDSFYFILYCESKICLHFSAPDNDDECWDDWWYQPIPHSNFFLNLIVLEGIIQGNKETLFKSTFKSFIICVHVSLFSLGYLWKYQVTSMKLSSLC